MKPSIYALAVEETARQAELAALKDEVARLHKTIETKDGRALSTQRQLIQCFHSAYCHSYQLQPLTKGEERRDTNARMECYANAARIVERFLFVF